MAVSDTGPVGVDVEDPATLGADLATLERWCAIEAALKATGSGLSIDPDHVVLASGQWSGAVTLHVPGHGPIDVLPVDLPGVVGRVATGRRASAAVRGSAGPAGRSMHR